VIGENESNELLYSVKGGSSILEIPDRVVVLGIPVIVGSIFFLISFSKLETRLFSLGAVHKMAEF